jgi:hypothetical protein
MTEFMDDRITPHDASDEHSSNGSNATNFGMESQSGDVSEEEVRSRAHEIYLRRGGFEGDPVADWLEAEREVRGRSMETRRPDDLADSAERG